MVHNRKNRSLVTESFIRDQKLIIIIVFSTHSYNALPRNARLKSTRYFNMKIPNKNWII